MKKSIDVLIIFSTFAQLNLFCKAGLLDLLIRGERRLLNRHHDGNVDYSDQFSTGIQNNAANPFYPEYNIWRSPVSTLKPEDYMNKVYGYDTGAPDNNFQEVENGGMPFTNRNNGNGQGLTHGFSGDNGNFNNKPINSNVRAGNNPAHKEKIMNDIKKINTYDDAMRKQNAGNSNVPKDNNGQGFTRYPNYNHQTRPTIPTVHINNRVSGDGKINDINNQGNLPYISNTLHYNTPTTQRPIINYHNNAATNSNPFTEKPVKVFTSAVITEPDANSQTPKPNLSHPSADKHSPSNEHPKGIDNDKKVHKQENDQYVLKPIRKRKFFVQVAPIVPEDKFERHNVTVYYVDK